MVKKKIHLQVQTGRWHGRAGVRWGKTNPPSDAAPFTSLLNNFVHYFKICCETFAQLYIYLLSNLSSLCEAVCCLRFKIR